MALVQVTTMKKAREVKERPEQGCYISGLYLEGAAWDHDSSILRRQEYSFSLSFSSSAFPFFSLLLLFFTLFPLRASSFVLLISSLSLLLLLLMLFCSPKMLVVEFPIIHIIPMEVHKLRLQGTFHTPVYITQERRNKMGTGLVFAADLPTKEHPSHWVLHSFLFLFLFLFLFYIVSLSSFLFSFRYSLCAVINCGLIRCCKEYALL